MPGSISLGVSPRVGTAILPEEGGQIWEKIFTTGGTENTEILTADGRE
jgi:hypothetical protein